MPSFAKAKTQSARAINRAKAIGTARHNHRDDGKVHGLGSARNYEQSLSHAAQWDRSNGGTGLDNFDNARALAYLSERAEAVEQKQLDLDRKALELLPHVQNLERIRSERPPGGLSTRSRSYTPEQVAIITQTQAPHNALATEIALAAGLRGHELFTLRPTQERGPDQHRPRRNDLFTAREGIRYTVTGKGGLTREVLLPQSLAERLEAQRLATPQIVTDRKITYQQHYKIGGGNAWSNAFGRASRYQLGWSTGAHGLRHTYAQQRMEEVQRQGYRYQDAMEIVSQEMGHYRPDIVEVYLR
jgi:integrase